MIIASNINKSYGPLQVLKDVSIHVAKGEVVSIVGASGAGKTTLLQIVGTLDKADSGKVLIDGHDVTSMGERALAAFRNKNIGFVFQSNNLLPEFTALENICLPAMIAGHRLDEVRDDASRLLDFLGIGQRANHKPSQLSGGEQQRVAVARALINKPTVVLADEPSGNLDTLHARELHELFFRLRDQYNLTFVIVTHNSDLATMSDRQIILRDGRVAD